MSTIIIILSYYPILFYSTIPYYPTLPYPTLPYIAKVWDVARKRIFWHNHLTKESVWDKPLLLKRYGDIENPCPWHAMEVRVHSLWGCVVCVVGCGGVWGRLWCVMVGCGVGGL
jgi:hypothetical protein